MHTGGSASSTDSTQNISWRTELTSQIVQATKEALEEIIDDKVQRMVGTIVSTIGSYDAVSKTHQHSHDVSVNSGLAIRGINSRTHCIFCRCKRIAALDRMTEDSIFPPDALAKMRAEDKRAQQIEWKSIQQDYRRGVLYTREKLRSFYTEQIDILKSNYRHMLTTEYGKRYKDSMKHQAIADVAEALEDARGLDPDQESLEISQGTNVAKIAAGATLTASRPIAIEDSPEEEEDEVDVAWENIQECAQPSSSNFIAPTATTSAYKLHISKQLTCPTAITPTVNLQPKAKKTSTTSQPCSSATTSTTTTPALQTTDTATIITQTLAAISAQKEARKAAEANRILQDKEEKNRKVETCLTLIKELSPADTSDIRKLVLESADDDDFMPDATIRRDPRAPRPPPGGRRSPDRDRERENIRPRGRGRGRGYYEQPRPARAEYEQPRPARASARNQPTSYRGGYHD
jgi:hypothetical protein